MKDNEDIAMLAYKNVKDLVRGDKVVISSKALSVSFFITAERIIRGDYKTLEEIYSGLKTNNNYAIQMAGEDNENWQYWDEVIQQYIALLNKEEKLPSFSDHANLFKEIATGLSYVRL